MSAPNLEAISTETLEFTSRLIERSCATSTLKPSSSPRTPDR